MEPRARRKRRRILVATGLVVLLGAGFVWFGNDLMILLENERPSRSLGQVRDGTLEQGKRLPTTGPNFRAYGRLPAALGRNHLHGTIRDVVLEAYAALETTLPDVSFVYGECSRPGGGPLKPHNTHQNGLSIDFMVPVRSPEGPARLPAHIGNKYGYGVDFDEEGYCARHDLTVDFEAIGAHVLALAEAAEHRGIRIDRIVFTPDYRAAMQSTSRATEIAALSFTRVPSWVRHDDHYHVDFTNPDPPDPQAVNP